MKTIMSRGYTRVGHVRLANCLKGAVASRFAGRRSWVLWGRRSAICCLLLTALEAAAVWSPKEFDALVCYDAADPSTLVLSNVTNVARWNDKSGNNRHALQNNSAKRPSYVLNGIGGLPMLRFASSWSPSVQHYLESYKFASPTNAWTFFTVYSVDSNGGSNPDGNIIGNDGGGWKQNGIYIKNGSLTFNRSGTDTVVGAPYTQSANALHVLGTVYSTAPSSNAFITLNGTVGGTVNNLNWTAGALGFYGIGAYTVDYVNDYSLRGYIAEHIVFPTNLSTLNRQKVEGYLAWKWGVQASLPTNHPYKNRPPLGRGTVMIFR